MRWEGQRRSDNVEDRRGSRAVRLGVGGGLGGVVLVILYLFLGGDPAQLQQSLPDSADVEEPSGQEPGDGPGGNYTGSPEEEKLAAFVSTVLADTEDVWREVFRSSGRTYRDPKLVLFTDSVDSGCGIAEAAVGPFYCPRNEKVYIDLSFYQELQDRFGAPGDFAQAYVIAHEVGHHVQNLLGISEETQSAMERVGRGQANALSVRVELQADCLAGVWANHAQKARDLLEAGDVAEGLRAASAIGDDRMQRRSQGYVAPDSFTHGSSEQRVRWFRRGIEAGDLSACDTFSAESL